MGSMNRRDELVKALAAEALMYQIRYDRVPVEELEAIEQSGSFHRFDVAVMHNNEFFHTWSYVPFVVDEDEVFSNVGAIRIMCDRPATLNKMRTRPSGSKIWISEEYLAATVSVCIKDVLEFQEGHITLTLPNAVF